MLNDPKTVEQLRFLFSKGIDVSIIKHLAGRVPFTKHEIEAMREPSAFRHRTMTGWIKRDKQTCVTADRLIRLYHKMFPDNPNYCVRKLNISGLYEITCLYYELYPSDEMSPNRIYYFLDALANGKILATEKCSSCGLPFIQPSFDVIYTKCSGCDLRNLQNSKKILAFFKKKASCDKAKEA